MHGDTEDWAVGDENAGVADRELPRDTATFDGFRNKKKIKIGNKAFF